MMDINEVLASVVYEFFVKETTSLADKSAKATGVNNKIIQSEQLAEELYKPINYQNIQKRKIYSSFKDNIWGPDLADMQLISAFNKGIRFLLFVIDLFSKYSWVFPLKVKKSITMN